MILLSALNLPREILDLKNPPVKELKDRTRLSCLLAYASSIVLVVGGVIIGNGGGIVGVGTVLLGVVMSEFSHYYAAQGGAYRARKEPEKK